MMRLLFLCFLFFIKSYSWSQTQVLNKYIQKGLSNNLKIQQHHLSIDESELNARAAKSYRRPQLSFNASYLLAEGGRRIEFPLSDLVNPINGTLNQLTGSNDFPTDISNFSETFIPNNFQDTRLKLRYAVYNETLKYQYLAQQQLVSLETAEQVAIQQDLIKNIKIAYYQYFKSDAVIGIFMQSKKQLEGVYDFNKKLVDYNQKTADILFQVTYEIEKNNAELLEIEQQKENAKAHFNSLLNTSLNEPIEKDGNLKSGISNHDLLEADLSELQNLALQQRPELVQLSEAAGANEILVKANQKSMFPTLNLEVTSGFQGTGYRFQDDQFLNTLGVGFDWLLYDGGNRKRKTEVAQIANAKIQKDIEIAQQQIRLEVQKQFQALQTAQQKITVEQALLQSAQSRYDLLRKRYESGEVLLIELLDAQTKYTQARLGLEVVEFDLLIRLAELERALGMGG
ncbi:MAG: TolC family protein [Bacteroidota bacterium]